MDFLLQTAPLCSLITVRLALGIPKQKEAQTERGSTEITHDMSPHTWVTSCTTWSKSAGEHLPMSPHPPTTMDKRTLAVPLCRTGPPSPQYPLEPTRSQVVSGGNQRSECECHEGLCWAVKLKHIKTCKRCYKPPETVFHMAGSPPSRRVYDTSNIPQDLQSQSVHPHAGALLTARAASSAQGMAKIIRSHVEVKTVAIRTKHLQILEGFQLHRMRGCINLDYRYLTVSRKPVCHSICLYCLCICVCLSLFIWLCARALTHINE